MKSFNVWLVALILGIISFSVSAGDLLGSRDTWPTTNQSFKKARFTNEERGGIIGGGIGYILGGSKYKGAAAVIGLGIGSWMGARADESKRSALADKNNCRLVYARVTDPATGRPLAQESLRCDQSVQVTLPVSSVMETGVGTYNHSSSTMEDPMSQLSSEERKLIEEHRALQRPTGLTDDEWDLIKRNREQRQSLPQT